MSFPRQLTRGLRDLFRPTARTRELDEELQQFYDEAAADASSRGLAPDEARRAAQRQLGNPSAAREQVRSFGWENTLREALADLRFATRHLRSNPGFATVAALTLALGIGAATAIFSAVYPVLFQPLPYPHAGRILTVWNTYQGQRFEAAFGTFRELQQRSRSFDAMAIFEPWQPALVTATQPERLQGQAVSAGFFHVLGVAPALGRDFLPADDLVNGPAVVILSDRLWRRQFHADPALLGRSIKLSDTNFTVIGVLPASFEDVLAPSAEIWTTAQYDPSKLTAFNTWAWGDHLRIIARLLPGVPRAQAADELNAIARTPWPQFPRPRWASLRQGLIVDSLQHDLAHTVQPALLAILGAVFLVLAIACVNVLNLVLARSAQRRGEFSMRGALGASRLRILRQLVTESLLLAFLGGSLGIAFALAGIRALVALSPPAMPRLNAVAFHPAAFLFAFSLTALVGLIAGLVPTLHLTRHHLQSGLRQTSARASRGRSFARRALVVSEVALALVLLVSAGLLLHSMKRLLAVDPGFEPSHLLTLQVQSFGHRFDDSSPSPGAGSRARWQFFRQALDAVRQVPGVDQAAFTSLLPLSDAPQVEAVYGARFEGDPPQAGRNVFRYAVSPGYCQAMSIPLRAGRFLDDRDTADAPHVALISESLARARFPHGDALGKRLKVGPDNQPWFTIIGVVGNVRQTSLALDESAAVYIPAQQSWFADSTLSFIVRTRGDAAALAPAAQHAIWSIDPTQPIVRVLTMNRMRDRGESERRFVLTLFETFGLVALLLAAVGIYGVLSGSVVERHREIGVRAALGATRRQLLTLVLGDGMRLTAIGMAIGLLGALAASQALAALLYGTSRLDPATWIAVLALLALVAALACLLPAWRAARINPATTLRAE
ncbi:ABC transporter permease [Acidobacteria bacterium AB60]|nr:ABC transporter permease [Acidobacteria bacterium AB60]